MVMGMVGFADGYRKQQDAGERKRLELAKAFQEFQQSNPEATGMEYQAFMDSMSGGDNYLRGGMPSGPALRAVVGESERRRTEADQDRNHAMMSRNIQLQQELEGTATGIMLNYPDPGPNGYSQNDYATMSRDLEQRFPGVDLAKVGFDPTNMFSNERRANAIAMKIKDYLPGVRDQIKAVGGKNVTPEMLAQMGVPPALIQPLISQASTIDDEIRYDWANSHRTEINKHVLDAVAAGRTDIYQSLVEIYGDSNLLPAEDSDFINTMESSAIKQHQKNEANDSTQRAKAVEDWIDRKTGKQSFKASLSNSSRADILKNLAEQIPHADLDVNAMFGSYGKEVTRADVIANPEEYLGAHIDGVISEMRVAQGNASGEQRLAAQANAATKAEEYKVQQTKKVEGYFGQANDKAVSDVLGKNGRNARLAALQLAEQYSMTPSVLSAMEQVFRGLGKIEDVATIKNAVKADANFKNATGGRTIVDDVNDLRATVVDRNGGPEITSFPNYIAQEKQSYEEGFSQANDEIMGIVEVNGDNPSRVIEQLNMLKAELKNATNTTIESWDHYGQLNKVTNGGLGWIEIGGERWDDNQIKEMSDDLTRRLGLINDDIDFRIKKAEEKLKEQPTVTQNVDTPEDRNAVVGGMVDIVSGWSAENKLSEALGVFSSTNPIDGVVSWIGSVTNTEKENARSGPVIKWYKANKDRLVEYASEFGKKTGDNSVLDTMVQDVKTMTEPELEAKYGPVLRALGDNRQLVPAQ